MPEHGRETLAYESLGQPLSPLFLDYLAGRERVFPFLGADGFDLDAIERAGERTLGFARPRAEVAKALARQQQARGAERRRVARERSRSPTASPSSPGSRPGSSAGRSTSC